MEDANDENVSWQQKGMIKVNLLHGLYDEQTGQQMPGAYSYAEIGKMIGRSYSAIKMAEEEEKLIARRYRILPDPILAEWDTARMKILKTAGRRKRWR